MNRLVVVVATAALISGHSLAQDSVAEVPPNVMKAMILTKVDPVYPQSAITNHVGGIVALRAIIDKSGQITKLDVIKGPEALQSSALEAVKQWTFVPYLANRQPTTVSTIILVQYSPLVVGFDVIRDGKVEHVGPCTPGPSVDILSEEPIGVAGMAGMAGMPRPDSGPHAPIKIPKDIKMTDGGILPTGAVCLSSGVSEGNLLSKIQPKYPAIARAAKVQGAVVLHAQISESGSAETLSLISGPPMLVGAAINAVNQWKWKPYFLNGKPTKVETTVIVNFTLEQ